MMVADQAEADFDRARRRAFFGGLKTRFVGGRDRLLSFDEVRKAFGVANRFYLGRKVVEVSKMVGSVGRHGEFDGNFMPAKSSLCYRWKRVDGPLPQESRGRHRSRHHAQGKVTLPRSKGRGERCNP